MYERALLCSLFVSKHIFLPIGQELVPREDGVNRIAHRICPTTPVLWHTHPD